MPLHRCCVIAWLFILFPTALLQGAELTVMDESFAALDPKTLDEVLAAVLSRPEALVVIAHP